MLCYILFDNIMLYDMMGWFFDESTFSTKDNEKIEKDKFLFYFHLFSFLFVSSSFLLSYLLFSFSHLSSILLSSPLFYPTLLSSSSLPSFLHFFLLSFPLFYLLLLSPISSSFLFFYFLPFLSYAS